MTIECRTEDVVLADITMSDCGGTLTGMTNSFTVIDNSTNIPITRRYDLWIDDGDSFYDTGASIQYPNDTIVVTNLPVDGREITKYLYYWDDPSGLPTPLTNPDSGTFVKCTCTTANIQNLDCMSFTQIREAGRLLNSYPTGTVDYADAHLAEFLYMDATVSNWDMDAANEEICKLPDPEPSVQAFQLPLPTGGNDFSMIQGAISTNAEVRGVAGAVYQLNTKINVASATEVWDVAVRIGAGIGDAYQVTAPNVSFYRSPIDGNNTSGFKVGWRVEASATNFTVSRSGVRNIRTPTGVAAGVWIRGGHPFKITCNEFIDLLLDAPASATGNASILAVLNSGGNVLPGGYIANNYSENIHARRRDSGTTDPEFYKQQGYGSTIISQRPKIIANRCVNAGKRLTKFQESEGFVASNFYHWRDRQGPLGVRLTTTIVAIQVASDRIRAINNRVKIEAEARYNAIWTVLNNGGDRVFDDLHFDCNDLELIDVPPQNFYAQGLYLADNGLGGPTITSSSAVDNVWRGPGGTNHLFRVDGPWGGPLPPAGLDISGNIENTPVLISDFNGSGANYVP